MTVPIQDLQQDPARHSHIPLQASRELVAPFTPLLAMFSPPSPTHPFLRPHIPCEPPPTLGLPAVIPLPRTRVYSGKKELCTNLHISQKVTTRNMSHDGTIHVPFLGALWRLVELDLSLFLPVRNHGVDG